MMFDSTSNEAGILFACSIVKLLRILDFNYLQLLDFLSLGVTFYIPLVKSKELYYFDQYNMPIY